MGKEKAKCHTCNCFVKWGKKDNKAKLLNDMEQGVQRMRRLRGGGGKEEIDLLRTNSGKLAKSLQNNDVVQAQQNLH